MAIGMASMSGAGHTTGSITFNICMGHTETFEVIFFGFSNTNLS